MKNTKLSKLVPNFIMDRFWDKNNNYAGGTLKEYAFWVLEVSYKQHTFGNFIVFCKRQGVEKISELLDEE